MLDLNEEQIKQINDFQNFKNFQITWAFDKFIHCTENVVAMFTGNQFGKTSGTALSYVMRVLGIFPIPEKNAVYWECENIATLNEYPQDGCHSLIRYKNKATGKVFEKCLRSTYNITTLPKDFKCPKCKGKIRKHIRNSNVFRFCAVTLPGQSGTTGEGGECTEVKNTQYPAFKLWLPNFLIKKDITARNTSILLHNLLDDKDIIIDFVAYSQTVASTAGTQRISIWYDEEPPIDFREEQIPRLLAENGDEVFTVTPADHITWQYDEIYEKASVIYRTEAIRNFYKTNDNKIVPKIERTDNKTNIAVIQAATDDNPTLTREAIDNLDAKYDDPDTRAIRRYGIFKQVSGRIFKDFTWNTHIIDGDHYFPHGVPYQWKHARGIDFHPKTPWGFAAMSISPQNEVFVWLDLNPSPEKLTTELIAQQIAVECEDYKFTLDLIDPLAVGSMSSKRRSLTSLDDLNEEFRLLRREGLATSGYWEPWDTKGEYGRNEIRKRLRNSLVCQKPLNNFDEKTASYLPTIWIFNTCLFVAKSLKNWRWEEYRDNKMKQIKGDKNSPEQRWSHHCMVLEAIFKDPLFGKPRDPNKTRPKKNKKLKKYFQGKYR